MLIENAAFEKHYRIGDLARTWGLGRETVRKLVKDDPGVVKVRLNEKAHTVYERTGIPRQVRMPHAVAQPRPSLLPPGIATSFGFRLIVKRILH